MPWIYTWASKIQCAYIWTTAVKCIYVWDTKVRPTAPTIEWLLVWGWAAGSKACASSGCMPWGWGWGWGVVYCASEELTSPSAVVIGKWSDYCCWNWSTSWPDGCSSCFHWIIAYWGWGWGGSYNTSCAYCGRYWWSGWGWGISKAWWSCQAWQWCKWWTGWSCSWGWWWGRCDVGGWGSVCVWGRWWMWYCSDISWTAVYYWSWWTGWSAWNCPPRCTSWYCWGWGGWGCWQQRWGDGLTPWSWGWGGWVQAASWLNGGMWWWGARWIFIARYKTSCWYKIFWGCKYICGDYTIHCFETNWCLILEPTTKTLQYLVVWWGGGWWNGWGWGWAVCMWVIQNAASSYNIVVGTGGAKWWGRWCPSCLWTSVIAYWGYGWCDMCRCSWCACWAWWAGWCWSLWWASAANSNCKYYGWWGWGWAGTKWHYVCSSCCWWGGWRWLYWYGWWGSGWWKQGWCDVNIDGWGKGTCTTAGCTTPTNCGWWGWGACTSVCAWAWADWLVEICYAADGSSNITCATWGTKLLRDGMCVHRFTSNGTFTIVS